MQLGAVLPHNEIGTDPGAIRTYVQGVEELGMTHLLAYDHVLGADPNRPGGFNGVYDKDVAFHEPLTFFAFAAALTRDLEFASTVLILPQRQAVLVAKQAAEVAVLSGNRLRLGIGTGWNKVEYDGLNENFNDRGRRQVEQVEVMRLLWTEDVVNYKGTYHTIDAASIDPRPSRPVPIWFGGTAPVVLERSARLGDGFMPLGSPDKSKDIIDIIRQHREQAGLSMDGYGIQAQAQFAGGTPERWRSHADKWRDAGATHLAIATHNAGETDVDGHLDRVRQYRDSGDRLMALRLDGKAAIVTGGSKGIGKGIAKAFADAGANVLITARKPEVLETAAAELGPSVSWLPGHTGRPEDGERVVAACMERYGSCDVLVNNAATNPYAGPLINAPLSAWDKTVEVNLRGPLAWSQIAWQAWMKDHAGCSIINIASVGGFSTSPDLGLYAVLKAALIHMTKQLAAELAPNVRVNAIAPAVIRTDFARILWEGERGDRTARSYPLQRLGEPEDVGETALYLAAGATWMTGQTLVLDGGGLIAFRTIADE